MSFEANAQIALPSIFPDTKAINPGIISMRQMGHVRVAAQNDKITKDQNVEMLNGSSFVYNDYSRIDLKNLNFFYGGRGGGYTSEINAGIAMGDKQTSLTDSSKKVSNYKSTTSSKYFEYSLGMPSKWGFSAIVADYKSEMISDGSINGMAFNNNKTIKNTLTGGRIGKAFGSNMISLGMHVEIDNLAKKNILNISSNVQKVIGVGIGGGGKHTHLEVSIEAAPLDKGHDASGAETSTPTKMTLVLETKFGSASLGYTGTAYRGSFVDIDKLVQTQLIYANQNKDTRLEHTINFSLSSSKGCSIGAMAMFSKSNQDEFSSIFQSKETHKTKTRSISIAAKIGYSF